MQDPTPGSVFLALQHLEESLYLPQTRFDSEYMEGLLSPDFVEFGSSGRVWDRASMIAALVADPGVDPSMSVTDMTSVAVDANAALVTYVASTGERTTLRSSLWLRTPTGWRLRFHQGTVAAG